MAPRSLAMFAMLLKETQPFRFFGLIAMALLTASLALMAPVLGEYFTTGLVPRLADMGSVDRSAAVVDDEPGHRHHPGFGLPGAG